MEDAQLYLLLHYLEHCNMLSIAELMKEMLELAEDAPISLVLHYLERCNLTEVS